MKFLKKKLLSFNLDEAKFKKFLQYFVANTFDQQAVMQETIIQQAKVLQNKQSVYQEQVASQKQQLSQEAQQLQSQQAKIRSILGELNGIASQVTQQEQCHELDGKQYCLLQSPNKTIIDSLLNSSKMDSENYLDSSNVLDTIKKQASCVFNTHQSSDGNYDKNGSQTMADLVDNRNDQLLKETCFRNKKYLDVDEDLVLQADQAWSVPQRRAPVCQGSFDNYQPNVDQTALIGTLLKDAKNTKVGSMLPLFPPKTSGNTL
jgi:hypothetical protein